MTQRAGARARSHVESHAGLRRRRSSGLHPELEPVSDSLGLTAIIAALPILALIVLLGGMKMKARSAAPIALVIAIAVAAAVYGMPVDQAALSAAEGATCGLFPIMWVVVAALWVYNMTVETRHFLVLGDRSARSPEDQRIQAVMIAFCFGTLLEALAGFGAPAAITAVMMLALGFKPITAAALALLGNTAAVPFDGPGVHRLDAGAHRHWLAPSSRGSPRSRLTHGYHACVRTVGTKSTMVFPAGLAAMSSAQIRGSAPSEIAMST